jgi:phosphoserine aminotransferase
VNRSYKGAPAISLLLALVAVAVMWQLGVFGGGSSSATSPQAIQREESQAGAVTAQSNLQAATPAAQAYFAENGTYAGLTLTSYDASAGSIAVMSADATSYCLQTVVGTQVFSMRGPGGNAVAGAC